MPLRILHGGGRGAAAALNVGLRSARFPIICQIDQDVAVKSGWMREVIGDLEDRQIAATQGYFDNDDAAGLYARAMNLDLQQRYAAISGSATGHVCTGNTAYRASALQAIGLFDESLGYGYDNDVSYRLLAAGFRLTIRRDARAVHRWREGFLGYFVQQYGFGDGRIDLVAKHPARISGDSVSPIRMMLQPILTAAAVWAGGAAALAAMTGGPWRPLLGLAFSLFGVVMIDRCVAGVTAARRFKSSIPLVFPLLHLVRNVAWVAAIVVWLTRRVTGQILPGPQHETPASDRPLTPQARHRSDRKRGLARPRRAVPLDAATRAECCRGSERIAVGTEPTGEIVDDTPRHRRQPDRQESAARPYRVRHV